MSLGYYPQFDVTRVDVNGYSQIVDDEDIEAYNITQSVSHGTLHTNAEGIIVAGHFTANAGDVVEFTSAWPLTMRLTLGSSPDDATRRNLIVKYLVENLYATTEPLSADLYLIDHDNPDAEPLHVGSGGKGTSVSFPLQSNVRKNFTVVPVTTDENVNKGSFNLDAGQPVTITGRTIETLWNLYSDVGNASTDDDLYTGVIPDSLMLTDGDRVEAMFAGSYAANADEKYPLFYLDGHLIYQSAEHPNGTKWKALLSITRSSSSTARCEITLFSLKDTGDELANAIVDISTLDFTAPLKVVCHGRSDSANDVVLKVSAGTFYAAANPLVYLMNDSGAFLTSPTTGKYLTR